ncbi:MAG: hypothetical protein JO035_08635 [Betaproteobacteria bacterium]|nr:hypothetical protein [Betaproteobacteria bacterium]
MAVKITDAGDRVMIKGDSREEVEYALEAHIRKGAKRITRPTAVGLRWLAACTVVRPRAGDRGARRRGS